MLTGGRCRWRVHKAVILVGEGTYGSHTPLLGHTHVLGSSGPQLPFQCHGKHVLGCRLRLWFLPRFAQVVDHRPAELITGQHVQEELDAGVDEGEDVDHEFPLVLDGEGPEDVHGPVDAYGQRVVRLDVVQHRRLEDQVRQETDEGHKACEDEYNAA